MTPAQLASAECANHILCGSDCYVAKRRCGYFERCVLPLAQADDFADAAKARQARAQYETTHDILTAKRERFCECGAHLPKRRRLCDSCRAERHRERSRRQMQKTRSPVIELSILGTSQRHAP